MTTDADAYREDARRHVEEAISCLSKVVIERCDGAESYKDVVQGQLRDSLWMLLSLRGKL